MIAENHRAAAAVKNGMSLSADPTDAMPKLNQKMDTIHARIINRSEYRETLFELEGNKKNARWKWLMEMRRQSQRWEILVYKKPNLL